MSKAKLKSAPPAPRFSFFVFSRLYLQPDGAFLAKPAGIYRAETLNEALAAVSAAARSRAPILFRVDQIIEPERK